MCSVQDVTFSQAPAALEAHVAAFAVLVHRYSGEEEVAIDVAATVDGAAIAPATLTLAITAQLPAKECLSRCAAALLSAGAAGVASGRATIAWRAAQDGGAGAEHTARAPQFAATIRFEDDGRYRVQVSGLPALCPSTTAWRVEGHYRRLLAGMTGEGAGTAGTLPWLGEDEREIIVNRWSGQGHDPSLTRQELLHQIFEAQADATPDNVAISCGSSNITYAELERRANQLARYLRGRGAGRGRAVGMLLPRGGEVYVALLGILKSGSCYVPLDAEYPTERVMHILQDCALVVTTSEMARRHGLTGSQVVVLDQCRIPLEDSRRLPADGLSAGPGDLCYVIYTSGSTGRPKGVQIPHRAACTLVRAESRLFEVGPGDRVYQGFSVAFDASVEEIWLALASGATLVAGTQEMVRSGPALGELLTRAGVTVLSCVPTLLSTVQEDMPTVRLLILGGETCPQDLVDRWVRPGRRVFNTYGPTEATVIATCGECERGKRVTIGRPVPNYRVYVLDSQLQPVPAGVAGEICIGGPCVSSGYVGRPELTAERFVADPFAPAGGDGGEGRMYRTGDLGRFTPDGEIEYVGRIDTQVKIRGFRVELAEIESVLMQHRDVLAAVAAVHVDAAGVQHLGAYLVPRGGGVDEESLKAHARAVLPAYMMPAFFETLSSLPTLPSGKVNRKALPAPRLDRRSAEAVHEPARTAFEKRIAEAWQAAFSGRAVSRRDDFFLDLGGHSLLAAGVVSRLRKETDFASLSVTDIYSFPTVEKLAGEMESRAQRTGAAPNAGATAAGTDEPPRASRACYYACALGQLAVMPILLGLASLRWLAPFFIYNMLADDGCSAWESAVGAVMIVLLAHPALLVLGLALKWAVIGRYKAGRYRLWGWFYWRWWLVNQVLSIVPIDEMAGTPLVRWYYRMLGARIGANAFVGSDNVRTFDLLSVGDDTSIGTESSLLGYVVEGGLLHLGPIRIGRGCFVGNRSILRPGTAMEDDSHLGELSLLSAGATIPAGQQWAGSPSRPTGGQTRHKEASRPGRARVAVFAALHAVGAFLLPVVNLLALLPGVAMMREFCLEWGGYYYLLFSPLAAISFVVLMCVEIALAKWLLLGRVKPGRHNVYSLFYLRKWWVDGLMDMSLSLLGPLYATLYLAPWYRLLGARLGRLTEISTACETSPDMLDIDDESFVADGVSLGPPRVEGGVMSIEPTRIGKRAFVGNSAAVPGGTVIGDNSLIGCLSAPPLTRPGAEQPNTSWLGSPAIFLPQRQASGAFSEEQTFHPTRRLYLQRLAIEFFRVTAPTTVFVGLASLMIDVLPIRSEMSLVAFLVLMLLLYSGCGLTSAIVVAWLKWLVIGKYRPCEKPLWSTFVWKTEFVTAMHENLANPFLTALLTGTPFLPWFFRLMGSRIGRRVYMETTYLTEYDLITIGDDVCLNDECTIQTHLFEDRVMKMSTIDIEAGCSVGCGSIVLYDTRMEAGSVLSDLSLLMKGETLPAGTRWEGTPARCGSSAVGGSVGGGAGDAPQAAAAGEVAIRLVTSPEELRPQGAGPFAWVFDLDAAEFAGTRGNAMPLPAQLARGLDPLQRRRTLAGRAMLRRLVAQHLQVRLDDVQIDSDAFGRPRLAAEKMASCSQAAGLDFNAAHSHNICMLGMTCAGRIGVDVEVVDQTVDLEQAMETHFAPAERRQLEALSPARRLEAFYRCWTIKEALVKGLGLGAADMGQVEAAVAPDGSVRLWKISGSGELAAGWRVTQNEVTLSGLRAIATVAFAQPGR